MLTRRNLFALGAGLPILAVAGPVTVLGADLRPRRCPENECGYLYDPEIGVEEHGIPAGVPFAELPDDWECPECGTPKYLW
jgi:rubredoxin